MFCHSELHGPFRTDALEILQSKGSCSGSENSCLMPPREQKGWGGEREGLFRQRGEAVGISMPLKLFAVEFSKVHNFLTRPCGRNTHAAAFRRLNVQTCVCLLFVQPLMLVLVSLVNFGLSSKMFEILCLPLFTPCLPPPPCSTVLLFSFSQRTSRVSLDVS